MDKLTIKSFHITDVQLSDSTYINSRTLYIREHSLKEYLKVDDTYIVNAEMKVIHPANHKIFVNSIIDFLPIATKVIGRLGEGVTHTLTGVYVMLTGIDENGLQVAEFGSSEGILEEQVKFNRPGTPGENDIILHIDVTLRDKMGLQRSGITAAHKLCDRGVQNIRDSLKKMNGKQCDERHEYLNQPNKGKKKVVIVKQVAGQGAMYDTHLFGEEPGGIRGGQSIIDLGNMPVLLSPNEYRDGALRAMH